MLRSPIYYDKALKSTIDLSQLAQVGDITGWQWYATPHTHVQNFGDPHYWVGFDYWFNNSFEPVRYRRPLRVGPKRWEDLTLVNPSEQLKTVGEEIYEIIKPSAKHGLPYTDDVGLIVTHHEKSGELVMVRNLTAERERLVRAWTKWKKVEPEIYAIIRKHLS